ncbi:DUF192 domain-containing protein [Blattabacterium cuenoti]|uniref:DUF192 domain-containing protein n=1 Tax=Blattabacterium cuenoti TaxID=1653831 RepID=UPI00163C374A|nr:DUF192 domain-containing protein [Blattabacterium cuenoti]
MIKKKVFLSLIMILFFLSSERSKNDFLLFSDIGDQLEIEFIKHGELYMKNENLIIQKIDIEFANNDIEKKNGLTYRSFLKENSGMLFFLKNKEEAQQIINMKDMRIPLDILYIDNNNTVIFINKYVYPMMDYLMEIEGRDYYSNVKYILEINSGMSDKWGVKKGITKIIFSLKKKDI